MFGKDVTDTAAVSGTDVVTQTAVVTETTVATQTTILTGTTGVTATGELTESAAITAAAVEGSEPLAVDTLHIFCALFGSLAGNLAVTFGARGGVFIGGGIVPRFADFFEELDGDYYDAADEDLAAAAEYVQANLAKFLA